MRDTGSASRCSPTVERTLDKTSELALMRLQRPHMQPGRLADNAFYCDNARWAEFEQPAFLLKTWIPGVVVLFFGLILWLIPNRDEIGVSEIGQGRATVVLVHDPESDDSTTLVSTLEQVRNILPLDLTWLVVDVDSGDGRRFAEHHDIEPPSVMLFSPLGKCLTTLSGTGIVTALQTALSDGMTPR